MTSRLEMSLILNLTIIKPTFLLYSNVESKYFQEIQLQQIWVLSFRFPVRCMSRATRATQSSPYWIVGIYSYGHPFTPGDTYPVVVKWRTTPLYALH